LLVGAAAAALLCGCGDDGEPSRGDTFAPREYGRINVRASAEANSGDVANPHLSTGKVFEARQYEVPSLLCVRSDSTDYLHVPDGTTQPGAPAVFWAVPPADATHPVLLVFHGNGLDFIEAEATLFTHKAPRAAQEVLSADPGTAGYVEILNRGGALRGMFGEFGSAHVAEALERGWGVVVPGNCWGDGGHHRGEVINYYLSGPRWGRVMDDEVWRWFRDSFAHDARREYSYGCSGGGQRTAQLLLSDPDAVAASGIDSPADYLLGFKDDPPGLFQLLSSIPGYLDVLDQFYIQHYGSFAGAAAQSLGTQLLPRHIQTPIYLAYSNLDTFATNAVTAPLASALRERTPAQRSFVWNSGEETHCQINTRQRAAQVMDWLGQWQR
jgi:hypothetical protein